MSWSVAFIGKPGAVVKALAAESAKYTDQSKAEYDEAYPHLAALVAANMGPLVKLTANGHASFSNGVKTSGQCNVVIDTMYGALLTEE